MDIKPIRNEEDYRKVLEEVSRLFNDPPRRGTADGDRFEVLLALVGAFESEHSPIDPPDPIEAIKFRMEQQGLGIQDMVPLIGARNRVYEVLNETRPLTLAMIKRIRNGLKISGDVLLGQRTAAASATRTGIAVKSTSGKGSGTRPKAAAKSLPKTRKRRRSAVSRTTTT